MKFLTLLFFSLLGLFVWLVLNGSKPINNNLIEPISEIETSQNSDLEKSDGEKNDEHNLNIRRIIASSPGQKNPEDASDTTDYQSPAKEKFAECRDGNQDACKVLSSLCQERDFDACYYIGQVLGRGNIERATKYYKFACDQISHADSCYELAMTMQTSRNETDINNANSYFHVACFEGNVTACLKLADLTPDPEQRELYLAEASRFQEIKASAAHAP